MDGSRVGRTIRALLTAGIMMILATPSQAFWQRSQVSMCADATSAQEHARHRCDELRAYSDPGWPLLGVGGAVHRAYPRPVPGHGDVPGARPPVRRLG